MCVHTYIAGPLHDSRVLQGNLARGGYTLSIHTRGAPIYIEITAIHRRRQRQAESREIYIGACCLRTTRKDPDMPFLVE